MLHQLETLIPSAIIATDGEMGKVRDFLFNDQSWMVRYLIVDVGTWFFRRAVVLEITAIDRADWVGRTLHVHLTRQQVRNCPDVNTEKPVSRQQDIAMKQFLGLPNVWMETEFGLLYPIPAGREYPVRTKGDPHLRSAWALAGYQVWTTDGELGRLNGFILEETGWHLDYLDVKSGDWLHRRSVLLPTCWVKSISWGTRRINLQQARKNNQSRCSSGHSIRPFGSFES